MLRETTLNTKRLELGRCVGARKRKLSELYHVAATVAATVTASIPPYSTQTSSSDFPPFSELEFLEANDITKGKHFEIATLRRLPSGYYDLSQDSRTSLQIDPGDTLDGTPRSSIRSASQKSTSDSQGRHSPVNSGLGDLARGGEEKQETNEFKKPLSPSRLSERPSIEEFNGSIGPQDISQARPKQEQEARSSVGEHLPASSLVKPEISPKGHNVSQQSQELRSQNDDKSQIDVAVQFSERGSASSINQESRSSLARGQRVHGDESQEAKQITGPQGTFDSTIASRRRAADGQQSVADSSSATASVQNQKAPMRIDTAVGRYSQPESATLSSSFTPSRSAQAAMLSSPPERMTTRVSSGALRHKSVSEILGETPKLSPSSGERSAIAELTRDESSLVSRRSSFVASPESATFKTRPIDLQHREKDRSKLSTVVFARHQLPENSRTGEAGSSLSTRRERSDENKDYLVPLFAAQAAAQNPTLNHLIASAHKTLSTANHYIDYHESQDCRILKRIYHLQNSNRWSLRQLERSAEPPRQSTHWDNLLGEVKWLRTDFREERKWKLTVARNLAEMCAEWVEAPEEVRGSLQVKVRSTSKQVHHHHRNTPSSISAPEKMEIDDTTPELVHSADDETSDNGDDEIQHELMRVPAPAALFSLGPEDVLFTMDQTPISEKLLSELPLFQPLFDRQSTDRPWSEILDAAWQKSIVPVSKHAIGKIIIQDDGPRRKRSRYDYVPEDEYESLSVTDKKAQLPAEQTDVALFDSKNKHIVDRLHAGHAFRPPSQYPMPSQQFFECRNSSQWTTAEDDELRKLVREYEYNWNAISDFLTSPSLYSSGAERRTPWECFERWESFEGLPGEMDKHSYFRAWRSRKQNAKQKLEQGYLQQQQSAASAQPLRRRTAEPMHVDRRKSDKHYALIGAVAKVVKKREAQIQKQQHAAQIAAFRKPPETAQPRLRMQTPQEFSAHKHKQEMEFKEKQMLYRQQMESARRTALQQQKAAQQAVQQQQAQQQQAHQQLQQQQQQSVVGLGMPNQARMGVPVPVNGASPRPNSMGQSGVQPGNRTFSSAQQGILNGMAPNGNGTQVNRQTAMLATGSGTGAMNVPQAQMQSFMQGQHPGIPSQNGKDANRVMSEAMRLQEQQRMMQRQVRSQPNGHNAMAPLPNGGGISHQQMSQNPSLLGNMQHAAKINAMNGMTPGQQRSSASVAMATASQAQQLSSGMVPLLNQISNHLRQMHPSATTEQITQMATHQLNQHLQNQNAHVSNGMGPNRGYGGMSGFPQQGMNFNSANMSPQMYTQLLRSQQATQQTRLGGGNSAGANSSGGSTDANPNASSRPGSRGTPASQPRSSVAPHGASSSPPPSQAQMAGSPS